MTNEKQFEDIRKFRIALRRLMATTDGQIVEKALIQMYVDQSALEPTSDSTTMYRLGQKEFVQGLLRDSKEDLPEFNVTNGE